MKKVKRTLKAVVSVDPTKADRAHKEQLVIETSIKQLDTKHLTKLVVTLMREKLRSQSPAQLEKNFAKALEIRKADPKLFRSGSTQSFPLEIIWADRKNGMCSEQKTSVVFVKPEPVRNNFDAKFDGLPHNWKSEATN
jgi:hypothetical protein